MAPDYKSLEVVFNLPWIPAFVRKEKVLHFWFVFTEYIFGPSAMSYNVWGIEP